MRQKECQKCHLLKNVDKDFYFSNQVEKYPDGRLNICKQCILDSIDISNIQEISGLLQEVDVPYIKEQWNNLWDKYHNISVVSRYLARMRLFSFKRFRWKDTEWLNLFNLLQDVSATLSLQILYSKGVD